MLVTKQQTFLCETLDLLGGARLDQLAALIRPVFCLEQPDIAPRVVDTALRQLHHRNVEIIRDGDLAYYPGKKPDPLFMEMLLRKEKLDKSESVMVGNDFSADIASALAGGIDSIFLNTDHYVKMELERRLSKVRMNHDYQPYLIESGDIAEVLEIAKE